MKIPYKDFFGLKIWVGIIASEKCYLKEMKRLKIKNPTSWLLDNSAATLHVYEPKENLIKKHICLVCIESNLTRFSAYGLLVHEATHILQYIKEIMREDKIGNEMEAYAMQGISCFLWNEYDRLKTNA